MPDNLYRRGKTWYARIQISGADHRISLRTTSFPEARARLKIEKEKAQHFRYHGENRHSWQEAVVEWGKEPSVKPNVLDRYLVSINQVRGTLDNLYIDEITKAVISKVAHRAGVTNATRRRDLTAVSAVLRWCVSKGWAEENIAHTWDRSAIRERRDPIMLPEVDDIARVVAIASSAFGKMIRFAQYTGMRQEEIASLTQLQVDPRRKAVMVSRTKTNRPRSIPLDQRALGTFSGTVPYVGSAYVFWHGKGERFLNVASRFAEFVRRATADAAKAEKPFRRFRFHDLRHWYAVDYLRRGGNIYDLQQILGHASIRTTEMYLDYLTPDEQADAKRPAQNMAQL